MNIPSDTLTKLSVAGAILYCIGGYFSGNMDANTAIGGIIAAIGGLGVARKLERSAVNAEKTVAVLKVTAVETGVPPSTVAAVTTPVAEKGSIDPLPIHPK